MSDRHAEVRIGVVTAAVIQSSDHGSQAPAVSSGETPDGDFNEESFAKDGSRRQSAPEKSRDAALPRGASPLRLLGLSFRTASAAVRDNFSFTPSQAKDFLRAASEEFPGIHAAVLSTCNRTEFYLSGGDDDLETRWIEFLGMWRPKASPIDAGCELYRRQGAEAVRHLCRVASGLDSAVLGDVQILGQVKEARVIAAGAETTGRELNRLFAHATRAAKRSRRETRIGHGSASIGSALAGMLKAKAPIRGDGAALEILIIGAGSVAKTVGQYVTKQKSGRLTFVNRTRAHALRLAEDCGGAAGEWGDLHEMLAMADVIVCATSADRPILSRDLLDRTASKRPHRPLLVIDAGMPRNVEPGSCVEVIDIDAIREQRKEALAVRKAAVHAVERIVDEEVEAWAKWLQGLALEEIIKDLYLRIESVSQWAATRIEDIQEHRDVDVQGALRRAFKKALHPQVRALRRRSALSERSCKSCVCS